METDVVEGRKKKKIVTWCDTGRPPASHSLPGPHMNTQEEEEEEGVIRRGGGGGEEKNR